MMVEEREDVTRLSDDKDAVEDEEDMGSESTDSKKWVGGCQQ